MIDSAADSPRFQRAVVLALTAAVSILFLVMIRDFLAPLFLAAVFSGLAWPLHRRMVVWLKGRHTLAAGCTLLIVVLIVVIPCAVMLGVIATQGYQLSQDAVPWLQDQLAHPEQLEELIPEWTPFREQIDVSELQLEEKLSQAASRVGSFLFHSLSAAARETAAFFLGLFVMLYAMFVFLRTGPTLRESFGRFVPLSPELTQRLVTKGASITRATIKGTMVIGLVQGILGGIAFAVVGIPAAAFWGAVMAVASVIPGVGTALVWVPAVLYLLATGDVGPAIGLALWCAVVVGTVDNVLRPALVGSDTEMPDLLILVSTFGGLAMFGALGLIVGPTVAGICVTMWDVFGETFRQKGPSAGPSA